MESIKASGIIQNIDLVKIGVMSAPDRPGIASTILYALYEKNINVQFIVQITDLNNKSSMILCLDKDDLETALSAIENVKAAVQAEKITWQENIAMVSIFGPHFRDQPGVASVAFSALASDGINIIAISTSISTISCVIDGNYVAKAVNALRIAFNVPLSAVFTAANGLSLRSNPTKGNVKL